MMAMDLSVHNMDRDNNNDIRVVDLSLAKAGAKEEESEAVIKSQEADITKLNSEKLRALLPHLDIAALNILCLARLQVRENSLKCIERI